MTSTSDLETRAAEFAKAAHGTQQRKYTGEPYWKHCAQVAALLHGTPYTQEMLAAAWLHDVVEDCGVEFQTIGEKFGFEVMELVSWLTDVSKPEDGNRAVRKARDREHIAGAPPQAKTIKLADLISNSRSIVEHDPDFARVYLKEKEALLEVLREGDKSLWDLAAAILREGKRKLEVTP